MKVALIRPRSSGGAYEPPLGVLYIAGYLRKYGEVDVEIIDAEALNWDNKKVGKRLKLIKPDLVGISVLSYDRFQGFEIAEIAKKNGAFVVIGGPHVTFIDRETLESNPSIDAVVRGEGEATTLELVTKLRSKEPVDSINGLTFRRDDKIIRNPDREFIKDVDSIPLPAYDLVPMEKYQYYAVLASRGCPFNCIFCASPKIWKRKLRSRDPKKVVDEIEYLLTNYGKKVVHIKDDTFTVRKSWFNKICDEIENRNLKFRWECLGRVDTIDKEMLERLKKLGCERIEFGVETGDEYMMKLINKNITKNQVRTAISLAKEVGLGVGTFFMLGHPAENEKTINETFDFALELRTDSVSFNPTDIFPGTKLFDMAKEGGCIPEGFSWSNRKLNLSGNPVPRFENPELPEEKLLEYSKRFLARFAFCRMFDIKDERDLQYLFTYEHTPYQLTPRSRKDMKIIYDEFKEGIKRSPSIAQKIKGSLILPFFCVRFGLNGARRLFCTIAR